MKGSAHTSSQMLMPRRGSALRSGEVGVYLPGEVRKGIFDPSPLPIVLSYLFISPLSCTHCLMPFSHTPGAHLLKAPLCIISYSSFGNAGQHLWSVEWLWSRAVGECHIGWGSPQKPWALWIILTSVLGIIDAGQNPLECSPLASSVAADITPENFHFFL